MKKLIPDLSGKTVLDIGCGYGNNCFDFVNSGAEKAVGIDLSEKMLALAKEKNNLPEITYIHMNMADIKNIGSRFDFVYSSLVFHYSEDFNKLADDIFSVMKKGGELLFSQEHPFVTASDNGYIYNEDGKAEAYSVSGYSESGKRTANWFVDGVEKYHRTFSDIINALCGAGFIIEHICEPTPSDDAVKIRPGLIKEFIKPTFLIIKAKKP